MAWLKVLKKLGSCSTNSLPELLGIRAAEKENPKKENPEGFISAFTKAACWYTEGEATSCLLLSQRQAGPRFREMLASCWSSRMCFPHVKLQIFA